MVFDIKDVKKPTLDSSKLTNEFSRFLNNAIKMALAHSEVAKVDVFAEMVGLSPNTLTNIINHRTIPSYGQWLSIIDMLKKLSPPAHKWFCEQILGEWEVEE